MTYSEKLKDPKWQRKRLEIMERDEFMCMICGDTERTLNVHHHYYKNGKDPWDYPDEALVTLCEDCHENERQDRKIQEKLLLDTLKKRCTFSDNVLSIAKILNYTPLCLNFEPHLTMIEWWLRDEKNIKHMWNVYMDWILNKKKVSNG